MKVSVQEDEAGQPEVKVSGSATMQHKEEQPAPPMEASTPKRSEFAAVVFDQTAETYPVDANIECCYTLTIDITPSARDWVGVFKVGWLSPRDYLYYEWAPVPANYEAGKESQAKIIFQADRLPKDDGEFYQFCYVSSESNIRGASTPFQFKRPSADDYVELEDSDSEMLVIRPKTAFLEEEVTKYRKLVQSIETEREGLIDKLRKARNRADTCSHEATQLRSKYEELTCAMKDMSMAHDEVKSRLEMFEKERERLDDQVLREEQKVKECFAIIRALEAERDELAGLDANLKTEVATYRNSIVDLETQLRGVTMQLQQTEDQLHATHEMKKIMEDELVAYRLSQDKLSRDLESAYGQNHALKEQLQLMEDGFAEELKVMRAEDESRDADWKALHKKLELTQQENFVLKKQLDAVKKDTCLSQEAAASLFALQKANDALKSRHDKMSTALEEKEKELMSLTRQSRHKEKELKREAEDWKQRVEMCRAEYRTLVAENTKLRHRLGKYRKRSHDEVLSVSALQEEKATETVPAITKTVACQKAVTVVHSSSGDAVLAITTDAATDTDSSCSKMESLATELETRRHKKDKYKRLYLEEKERGDMLRSHYYEELQKRAAEIDEIKKEAAEEKDSHLQQIKTLQYYLEKQERQIARMTRSGNDYDEDHAEDSYPADWNPDSEDGTVEYPGDSEAEAHKVKLVHGNPYLQEGQVYFRPTTEEYEQPESEGRSSNREEEGACGGLENDMQHLELDGETSHTEEPTLGGQIRQLPPPLQPEILPGARLAAIRQQCGYPSPPANDNADDQLFEDCSGYAGAMPSAPIPSEYPEENERFMDAIGEGMKICPVCEMHIATMSDTDFAEHIVLHFGRLCPVCKIQVDDSMDAKVFEEHVNKCCESKRHGKNQ